MEVRVLAVSGRNQCSSGSSQEKLLRITVTIIEDTSFSFDCWLIAGRGKLKQSLAVFPIGVEINA